MRKVRQRDTGAERELRVALWSAGLRYQKHRRVAGTTPDVVFIGARVAVFVDGCFWHGCPVHYKAPVRNAEFWRDRLRSNQARDARDTLRLQAEGWRVIRVWECDLKRSRGDVVAGILAAVRS